MYLFIYLFIYLFARNAAATALQSRIYRPFFELYSLHFTTSLHLHDAANLSASVLIYK